MPHLPAEESSRFQKEWKQRPAELGTPYEVVSQPARGLLKIPFRKRERTRSVQGVDLASQRKAEYEIPKTTKTSANISVRLQRCLFRLPPRCSEARHTNSLPDRPFVLHCSGDGHLPLHCVSDSAPTPRPAAQ